MADYEQLRSVVEDLVEAMHLQAKELEKLVERVEQVAGPLGFESRLSVIASELSEIHRRVQKLGESETVPLKRSQSLETPGLTTRPRRSKTTAQRKRRTKVGRSPRSR